jgi:hypothetical protein
VAVNLLVGETQKPVRGEPTASAGGQAGVSTHRGEGSQRNPVEVDPELRPRDGGFMAGIKTDRVPITEDSPTVIIDSLDYPGGRGKSKVMEDVIAVNGAGGGNPVKAKAHIHRPAVLVSSEHVRGELMETWSCECGHVLPARKAK